MNIIDISEAVKEFIIKSIYTIRVIFFMRINYKVKYIYIYFINEKYESYLI